MAEACYTEPYLPASFKLVPFKAIDATSEHGRRGAEGEFPFGEQTGYADLGRRIRTYTISARFDSNNHVLEAAALIAVCELPGPGVFVHPTRGVILSAACRSLKVNDKIEEEGGVTYVDLEFVEANNWPNGLSLIGQLLGLGLSAIIGASRAHFTASYQPRRVQPFRQAAVVQAAQNQVVTIRGAYAAATEADAELLSRNRILNDLEMLATDDGLASDTATMDKGLALGMNAVAIEMFGRAKFRTFRGIANGAARSSTFNAPAATAENALYSNVRIIAASYMADGAMEETDVRTSEVFDWLDVIDALLEQEMQYARQECDNHLFIALAQFRGDVAARLYEKAYNAPGLVEYDFSGKIHPLVAAYSIFGDARRHRDIEAMNYVGGMGRVGPMVMAERGVNS